LPRPDHPARIRLSGGQVVDNDDGIVLDHTLEQGNPADAPQLAPAIERVIARTGRRPRTVTTDRGCGEKGIDEALHQMGVRTVVIPPQGQAWQRPPAAGHRPVFRRSVKCADRQRRPDQHPQTRLRMGPDRLDSTEGARIWTGHGILAHNLVKIGALAS
jgi:IS5 family transposase